MRNLRFACVALSIYYQATCFQSCMTALALLYTTSELGNYDQEFVMWALMEWLKLMYFYT